MTNKDLIMELVNNLEVGAKNAEIIAKILDCDTDGKVCDVVEVVRCKDCKYKNRDVTACCKLDGLVAIKLDSYCSKGERIETK